VTRPYLVTSMGLVTDYDVEHVKEVRELTEWKQNHGYEMGNTVKSQEETKHKFAPMAERAATYPDVLASGDRHAARRYETTIFTDSVDDGDVLDALTLVFHVVIDNTVAVRRWHSSSGRRRWRHKQHGRIDGGGVATAASQPVPSSVFRPTQPHIGSPTTASSSSPLPETGFPSHYDYAGGGLGPRDVFGMEIDKTFEAYRQEKEDSFRAIFSTVADDFALLHPRSQLLTALKEYLNPLSRWG